MILTQHNPSRKYSRIISLVPSQTELLHYLGLEDEVIGITKFCVHPEEWFRNKVRIGGTKNINFKKIGGLTPDLIIANKEENVKEQVEALAEKYDVWITEVNNLSDSIEMINDIGILTSCTKKASALAHQIKMKFENLQLISSKAARTVPAAYFIWKDSYMVAGAGTFIDNMMPYCGLKNIFSDRTRYPQIALEEIVENNCGVILLSSEPYPFKEKHKEEIQKKFPNIKVELVDGEMFSWYGSRLLLSVDYFHTFLMK